MDAGISDRDVELFTKGWCWEFAAQLSRLGHEFALVREEYTQGDEPGPYVDYPHAFVIDDRGRALDVEGRQSLDQIVKEYTAHSGSRGSVVRGEDAKALLRDFEAGKGGFKPSPRATKHAKELIDSNPRFFGKRTKAQAAGKKTVLYHGTNTRRIASIRKNGLVPESPKASSGGDFVYLYFKEPIQGTFQMRSKTSAIALPSDGEEKIPSKNGEFKFGEGSKPYQRSSDDDNHLPMMPHEGDSLFLQEKLPEALAASASKEKERILFEDMPESLLRVIKNRGKDFYTLDYSDNPARFVLKDEDIPGVVLYSRGDYFSEPEAMFVFSLDGNMMIVDRSVTTQSNYSSYSSRQIKSQPMMKWIEDLWVYPKPVKYSDFVKNKGFLNPYLAPDEPEEAPVEVAVKAMFNGGTFKDKVIAQGVHTAWKGDSKRALSGLGVEESVALLRHLQSKAKAGALLLKVEAVAGYINRWVVKAAKSEFFIMLLGTKYATKDGGLASEFSDNVKTYSTKEAAIQSAKLMNRLPGSKPRVIEKTGTEEKVVWDSVKNQSLNSANPKESPKPEEGEHSNAESQHLELVAPDGTRFKVMHSEGGMHVVEPLVYPVVYPEKPGAKVTAAAKTVGPWVLLQNGLEMAYGKDYEGDVTATVCKKGQECPWSVYYMIGTQNEIELAKGSTASLDDSREEADIIAQRAVKENWAERDKDFPLNFALPGASVNKINAATGAQPGDPAKALSDLYASLIAAHNAAVELTSSVWAASDKDELSLKQSQGLASKLAQQLGLVKLGAKASASANGEITLLNRLKEGDCFKFAPEHELPAEYIYRGNNWYGSEKGYDGGPWHGDGNMRVILIKTAHAAVGEVHEHGHLELTEADPSLYGKPNSRR